MSEFPKGERIGGFRVGADGVGERHEVDASQEAINTVLKLRVIIAEKLNAGVANTEIATQLQTMMLEESEARVIYRMNSWLQDVDRPLLGLASTPSDTKVEKDVIEKLQKLRELCRDEHPSGEAIKTLTREIAEITPE